MLVLLDNNYVDREGLRAYFEASPDNRAAIPHTVFVEWHKGDAEKVTRKVLRQACEYGRRIVILRDTLSLLRMRGQPKRIMTRLIDERQTAYFPTYCATFITGPGSEEVSAQFETHGQNARDQVDGLQEEAHKLMKRFAHWDTVFDPAELAEMKGLLDRDEKLSAGLQGKTFVLAEEWGKRQLAGHRISGLTRTRAEFINTLAFRYGAMAVAFYINWRNNPKNYPSNDQKVLNHFMDIKIAAQATYFDGFLTNDALIEPVYRIAMGMITALGGYTRCGNFTPVEGFAVPM
ncbi:hypothetical protein EBBID32_35490 [Sphingobium indicum BiD32]|uniref:Uncharacterized protein n=1 Tax=Sphingobium indicum BiD32 TaxID=1301087 RepID=N1MV52_9SPHN|nr:hypothetical protein [Sphingobium indicum]CCW19183.1 hypothetical protein EBBID32_35490 [Sphingobium indicum BiD32]